MAKRKKDERLVYFRVSEDELSKMEDCAADRDLTVGDLVRQTMTRVASSHVSVALTGKPELRVIRGGLSVAAVPGATSRTRVAG